MDVTEAKARPYLSLVCQILRLAPLWPVFLFRLSSIDRAKARQAKAGLKATIIDTFNAPMTRAET